MGIHFLFFSLSAFFLLCAISKKKRAFVAPKRPQFGRFVATNVISVRHLRWYRRWGGNDVEQNTMSDAALFYGVDSYGMSGRDSVDIADW